MDRTAILKQANEYITKDRQATHGAPEANFKIISELWSAYLNYQIKLTDVDLPDPLGPIKPTISFEFTSKLKFLTACTPPKFLLT